MLCFSCSSDGFSLGLVDLRRPRQTGDRDRQPLPIARGAIQRIGGHRVGARRRPGRRRHRRGGRRLRLRCGGRRVRPLRQRPAHPRPRRCLPRRVPCPRFPRRPPWPGCRCPLPAGYSSAGGRFLGPGSQRRAAERRQKQRCAQQQRRQPLGDVCRIRFQNQSSFLWVPARGDPAGKSITKYVSRCFLPQARIGSCRPVHAHLYYSTRHGYVQPYNALFIRNINCDTLCAAPRPCRPRAAPARGCIRCGSML